MVRLLYTADTTSAATASVTTKKKKEDKETVKSAVRARYLMEKYGMKWRSKVANGLCAVSFHSIFH